MLLFWGKKKRAHYKEFKTREKDKHENKKIHFKSFQPPKSLLTTDKHHFRVYLFMHIYRDRPTRKFY